MSEIKQWSFVDKSGWEDGPWKDEPDKVQWKDELTGLPCLIHRGPHGALCGYVGVPASHPAYCNDYEDVDVNVHGGLTFASECQDHDPDTGRGICHIPEEGETDDVWWLGFDCAHYGDMCPAYESAYSDSSYKTLAYIRQQVEQLAHQLGMMAREAV